MVPRRAFTWWAGPEPMTPLHQASVRSFKRHHPDWDVFVYWGEDGKDVRRRSDVWRWRELADRGGVWFDADVLWYGSLEPHLTGRDQVTMDVGTPAPNGLAFSIGVCVGVPGSTLYTNLAKRAEAALEQEGDQTTGTELLIEAWSAWGGFPEVDNLPGELIYRVPATLAGMDSLWKEREQVELSGIAMHWYGSRYSGKPPHKVSPIGCALRKAFE